MLNTVITSIALISFMGFNPNIPNFSQETILSRKEISLENRHPVPFVNEVFKYNILLNMAYLKGEPYSNQVIDSEKIKQPFQYEFKLNPNQTFAYHEDVLPEYKDKIAITTNAHFNSYEGFRSDGYLVGDGICHLASLIYFASKEANLDSKAPRNHDFASIPDIPREYGVAIYYQKGSEGSNVLQNLYVTNNREKPLIFRFIYQEEKLALTILEVN